MVWELTKIIPLGFTNWVFSTETTTNLICIYNSISENLTLDENPNLFSSQKS
jgi:hypothetical protein